MATVRRTRVKSEARFIFGRQLPTPDFRDAIRRAQERNRVILLGRVRENWVRRGHNRTGHTLQGFEASGVRDRDLTFSVFNRRPNASRVEHGVLPQLGAGAWDTAPPERVIAPRRGYTMRFYWERMGRWMTLPYVTHPGQKPDPVMQDSLSEASDEMRENINQEIVRALNGR
jgi:hypothetical protein